MKVNNLTFRYGENTIFENYTLEINSPVTCIMGASGRGKTTLLKLVTGLIEPDDGEVENAPVKPAMMFQEDRLLPWVSVLKNVELVCDNHEKAVNLLRELDIDESLYPNELSGGMARRVALARCLALDSDVLLLDEPFTGLNAQLMEKAARLILAQNKPVIVSTHSQQEAAALQGTIVML